MAVTVDYYKELELDRSWDEKTIREKLKDLQKVWTKRQSACNDKEQLLIIDKIQEMIENAFRFLTKAIKREKYDEELEKAYKNGTIKDNFEEKLKDLVSQAKAYYRKGNIKAATQVAQEAVDGEVNDPDAYDILARCYFEVSQYDGALDTVDRGIDIFKDDMQLHWLGARISTVGKQDYDDAQQRINRMLEIKPESPLAHSEQIYMHLRKGDEELAFKEIDTYIESHPNDEAFKKSVAYDLNNYSNKCLYNDTAQNTSYIADKKSYDEYLKLNKKAVEVYSDEYTNNRLEHAKYFGKKEWNSWNEESIKALTLYGIIFFFASNSLGLLLLTMDIILVYFSFRPYWQINKKYVTGRMGTLETIINRLGGYMASFARGLFKLIINFFKAIIYLVFRS